YEDGSLIDQISERMENTDTIHVEKKIDRENSGHFEAITVHHAEIRYPNGQILSRRQMSYDQLYVTTSPLSPMEDFEIPQTKTEIEWQKILNHTARQQLDFTWDELIKHYRIPVNLYDRFPLTYLHIYNHNRLPGFSRKQTEQAMGKLWDLLYRQYFTGIQVKNEKTVSPIGSTVPLLLFAKDGSRFIVLVRTKTGENVKLVQPLTPD
ncbi:MAG TPA: hypothetical protein VFK37_10455, partial [Bacillales bacterium]|nr:hypothetical protein [Bacillales bacterium]